MKKSAIEKSISLQAKKRYDNQLKELIEYLSKHPIASEWQIGVGDKSKPLVWKSAYSWDEVNIPITNKSEVEEKLIEKYEAEEVKNLEQKLDSVRYIFEQGGM